MFLKPSETLEDIMEDYETSLSFEIFDNYDLVLVREQILKTGRDIGFPQNKLIGLAIAISETCRIFLKRADKILTEIFDKEKSGSKGICIKISVTLNEGAYSALIEKPISLRGELSNVQKYFDRFDLSGINSDVVTLSVVKWV